jgi:subfamily B ATP-binding cassette protein MsbA
MSRVINDVTVLQNLINFSLSFITDVLTVSSLFIWVLILDWKLTFLVFIVIPAISIVISVFSKKMRYLGTRVQEKVSDLIACLQERLAAVRVIKAFAREDEESEKFRTINQHSLAANMKSIKVQSLIVPVVEFLNTTGLCLVLWYGGQAVFSKRMTPGELISFLSALGMMFTPMKRLTYINNYVQQSLAAAQRVYEVIDEPVLIEDSCNAIEKDIEKGEIVFENVSFNYDKEKKVLDNINLKIDKGKVVALVGSSGAGKSTLVNLVPRFYDVTSGKITIDGVDIRLLHLKTLRRQLGIVAQDTILFSGTIEENIAYGVENYTTENVVKAAKAANAHEFIKDLPEGYLTQVGERGVKLSGGQKQRISIARAIMTDPKILILDEATSALDTESEQLVQDALEKLMKNRTTMVIAHRLSTVTNADSIVFLDKGKIKECGKHSQLLQKKGAYAALFETQFNKAGAVYNNG